MTKAARVVFAALVVATFGAFFVAQRLKHGPTLVQKFNRDPVFSPNRDGRLDRERINFLIKSRDDVTVDVVDTRGDRVRRLADNRALPAYKAIFLKWDGLTDDGRTAPDGTYRVRVALRREGRSLVVPKAFRKDTTPPAVRVTSISPGTGDGPELLPTADGGPVTIRFSAPARRKRISIWRTAPGAVTRVVGPVPLADEVTSYQWDGTVRGRKVRPGTYLAVVEAQDAGQNIGASVPLHTRGERAPVITYGRRLPGRGGITVRYLGVQPPSAPLPAGRSATIFVDSRGKKVQWSLRRAGGGPRPLRRSGGLVGSGQIKVPIPRGESGLFVLTVRAGSHATTVALPVRSSAPHRVLVVLPTLTWTGRNPADDDGDGAINTLDRGVSALVDRVSVGDGSGLPVGLTTHEGPLLAYLDRQRHRYDLTADTALLRGAPPKLDGYTGVLVPGDMRWLPPALGARLRRYVRGGGTLALFGTGSLRAQVSVSPKGTRLVQPTALAEDDLFGARLAPLVRNRPTTLTGDIPDRLQLFAGGTGELTGYRSYERTVSLGPDLRQLSGAITESGEKVVVAARFGKGTVIRTGLPELPVRLADRNTSELVERTWTLLSR